MSGDYWRFPKIPKDSWRLQRKIQRCLWSYTNKFKYILRGKRDISEVINILTKEDMENTLPKSQMWFCMNFMSDLFSSETNVFK